MVNLFCLKKSYLSDVEKMLAQNGNILELLKGKEIGDKLFENLKPGSNYNRTLAKQDCCLNMIVSSWENLNISPSTQNHEYKRKQPTIVLFDLIVNLMRI